MRTDAHKIDVMLIDINIDFSNGLSSIGMEEYIFGPAIFSDFWYILNNTNLIMNIDDTNTEYLFLGLFDCFFKEV